MKWVEVQKTRGHRTTSHVNYRGETAKKFISKHTDGYESGS